ncbi:ABC transporter permease [Phyllobacterium zundukense]|uniref:Nickel/cobalt efflux system n=1 Tax=Phyllobacterium zundukense TaxID=1867719 RepID=A0A2N9W330_9HYPH|nr:ABC transporter permease [Phyllobacterium zundukense]ATU94305.1 ABC transporter permease [Phyllobacterium zundukense]PIO46148.1 ABC transporter permease [Phyllobacterium zundukense]
MIHWVIEFQREIYLAFGQQISAFAVDRSWTAYAAFLPMGILFGAVHAMTPGHSKSILATYLVGSSASMGRALLTSMALSFTHVTLGVVIAAFSLPLVSVALGSVGRAPMLESISRGLLGLIGLWMLWRALRHSGHHHDTEEGAAFGFMAGLIPCPLTLFVMTFAITRGAPEVGVAFAAMMMIGVALTLSTVAFASVFFSRQLIRLFQTRPRLIDGISRSIEGVAGMILVVVAIHEILIR